MSQLFHTKQVIAALMVAMTMLVPDVAWAQDSKLAVELVSFNGYFYENQGPENLLDGNPATKWCGKQEDENGQFVPFSIVVKTDGRSVLRKYSLTEHSSVTLYDKRDWTNWTIYGTNDAPESDDAQWTEIHKVTGAKLFDGAFGKTTNFTISDNTSAYKFYKVEVTAIVGMTRYDVWDTTTTIEHIQMMADMDFYGSWLNDGYDEHATEVLGVSDIDSGNTHSFGLEGAENAFDGITTNKWCGDFAQGNPYVQFTLEDNTKLNRYYLYTGNDITNDGNNRNPKEWKLYAKKDRLDPWEEIAHVTSGHLTTTASTRSDDYFIAKDKQESYYKYVKFEILQVEKGDKFEVGEFRLIGTPCSSHIYTAGKVVCNICGDILEHEHNYDEHDICTLCDSEKNNVLPFTVIQYSVGNNNEGADKAFDGIMTNKWCGSTTDGVPYVEMQYAGSARPTKYYLYTGNDITYGKKNRNPKEWKLYAKKDFDGEWTEISHVTDAQLPTVHSAHSQNYTIAQEYQDNYYQYFKFEILQVADGDVFEVGELCILGKPCLHEYADGSIVCSNCGYLMEHEHNYADGSCTLCGRVQGSALSFTLTQSHAGYTNEGPDKAVDGITTNKWCGDNKSGNPYMVLKHDGKAKLTHYNIYTGNDVTNGSSNRNPKEWKLYAKESETSQWVEISHINNAQLPTEHSAESTDYDIHETFLNTYYKYFKFEILQIEQGTVFEVGEIILSGTACEHQCDAGSAICRLCGDVLEHEHSYDENNTCTQCGEGRVLTFTVVRALSGTGDCTAEKAFDGVTTNKWCGEIANGPSYVLLRHDCNAKLSRYYLYTGNDIHHKESPYPDQERNPKEWKLYAKEKASDAWTMISHVNNAKLPSEFSVRSNVYDIDEAYRDKPFKFFKFEIVSAEKERMFEIGELCLIGSSTTHEYSGNTCTVCGAEKEHQHDYIQGICTKCEEYQPVEGEGTEASPYLIGNAGQLAWFRDETKLGREGICGKLTADIDMTSVCNETIGGWVAINTYEGVFDGDNHVIKNLYINDNDLYIGLFRLNIGTIKNLGIESGTVKGQLRVGAICGFNRQFQNHLGQIINCFNKANVSGIDPREPYTDIGGICGWNMGGVIDRCYNTGNISGHEYIGGICGASESNGIISNCYNTGNISGDKLVGGICGRSGGPSKTISCYSTGEVKGKEKYGAINGESDSKAPNNYYLNTGTEDAHGKAVTMAQFASGEVTWLLNGSVDEEDKWTSGAIDGTQAWYQKITISLDDLSSDELPFDSYPLLKRAENGSNTVVSDCINASNKYTNGTEVRHNHIGELVAQIDAKCEEAGSRAYRLCEDCGKHLDAEGNEYKGDDWTIPATGHQYGDKIVTLQPTCTEYGEQARVCSGCGAKKEISRLMPLWHNWDDGVVTKEPTCTESGEMTYTCSRCDGTKTESIDPEHHYDAGVVTHEPTCSKAGEIKYTCSRCEDTYTEVIAPLPHTLDDNLKCTVCGYNVGADCVIEYTATERLSIILNDWYGEGEEIFDYTDTDVAVIDFAKEFENWGEYLFGAPAIKHEYDEATGKGRIICSAPVQCFMGYSELFPERLTSITLPRTTEYISDFAFLESNGLTSITLLAENPEELNYRLNFVGCNNLQEIIVPYSAYDGYVEACVYNDNYYWYEDENGTEHEGSTCDLLKSLLTLDDTKAFENPTIEVKADATLQRSFANDGWYSLCLPFSVSVADSPFSKVAAFDTQDGDTYKFTTVDEIEAGKAYIVKVDAAVANPTFQNVLISTEAPTTDGAFIGVYSPTELGAGCKVIGSGTTVNPANAGMMKGFRAYFPASASGARAMRFTVDDGAATSISLPIGNGRGEAFYNTNGQRVNATHKGIVIKKGNKFVNQ